MKTKDWLKLVSSILLCQLAGTIGAIFTMPAISQWYVFLTKPFFSPPNWLFGPAWFVLYTLMGIALFLIWRQGKQSKAVFSLFLIHLIFNTAWSILFFGLRNPLLGLVDIIIMWALIVVIYFKFSKINKTAAYLLIPYWLWVSFATILNYAIVILN